MAKEGKIEKIIVKKEYTEITNEKGEKIRINPYWQKFKIIKKDKHGVEREYKNE